MALSWNEVKERWETEDGKERLAKVVEALRKTEDPWPFLDGFVGVDDVKNGRDLRGANLENTYLRGVHLEEANLSGAYLEKAYLREAHFEEANLSAVHMEGADLADAHLDGAKLTLAHLEGASLIGAHLEGARFFGCQLDRAQIFTFHVDSKTDFRGSNLDSALCESSTKNHLKYNIRRLNWEESYDSHPLYKWPVKYFWWLTNYGTDQWNLLKMFFLGVLFFGGIYYFWPEFLSGLSSVDSVVQRPVFGSLPVGNIVDLALPVDYKAVVVTQEVAGWPLFLRACYFSVVTMTTLGFGDIYAAPGSVEGHFLLIIQVLLGYFTLGALITRLGILFQSEGPTDIKKDEEPEEMEEAAQGE